MMGRGREGQLGRADTIESTATYRTSPQKVTYFDGKRVLNVQCGADHTIAMALWSFSMHKRLKNEATE